MKGPSLVVARRRPGNAKTLQRNNFTYDVCRNTCVVLSPTLRIIWKTRFRAGRIFIRAFAVRWGDNPMVNWQPFLAVFATIFVAEIGDKTQLATMLFSSEADTNRWLVWEAASAALVLAAGIGVLIGAQLERFVPP